MTEFRTLLINLPRWGKRWLLAASDLSIMVAAIWLAFFIRLSVVFEPPSPAYLLVLLAGPLICLAVLRASHVYRLVTRFIGVQQVGRIAGSITIGVLVWSFVILLSGVKGVPRSVIVLFGALSFAGIWGSRLIIAYLLRELPLSVGAFAREGQRRVLIYGAGETGTQLLQSLSSDASYHVTALVDDETTLSGQRIQGVKIYQPSSLARIVERDGVDEIILAMPSAGHRQRQLIIKQLEALPVHVKTLPSMSDIASGKVSVTDLRPIDALDLLGRDEVPADQTLLRSAIAGRCILVTGAGGSIGSELTRQIFKLGPSRLVLLELSEIALYTIEMELRQLANNDEGSVPEIVSVLGSAGERPLVDRVLRENKVHTIFHAAAYKHVPIVERNARAGLENNTFATKVMADAARAANVERVVLVSTDKAVRPTNIMGASKRLAELVLQGAHAEGGDTVFTMVRFGNVLDSSGSVLHLFRRQIAEGGPVTVTHPEITRYFMSIPEAALLVIQAGAMASGGEVFVLDMGEPVKIVDMARSTIRLSGRTVRDAENPDGDIEISFTGLREGEKLYEELLIAENVTGTAHQRIMRNTEPALSSEQIKAALEAVHAALDASTSDIQNVLAQHLEDYTPDRQWLADSEPSRSNDVPDAHSPERRTLH